MIGYLIQTFGIRAPLPYPFRVFIPSDVHSADDAANDFALWHVKRERRHDGPEPIVLAKRIHPADDHERADFGLTTCLGGNNYGTEYYEIIIREDENR